MIIVEKISNLIIELGEEVEKDGYAVLSVCDHSSWDKDFYKFRYDIIEGMKHRGYNVDLQTKWGVQDINITKKLDL
jgi:hypothetical protein